MTNVDRYSVETVSIALIEARGVQTEAAKLLGCDRCTVAEYIKRYPELKAVVSEAKETLIDLAEAGLGDHVKDRNLKAIMYVLSTVGKDRGYTQRTEHTGKDGNAIEIEERNKLIADETKSKLTQALNQ
ncbi:MAG: hypothetical protein JKY34_01295 [Kordiimonadaceae bacterium]|nr:hypothetical protein [Kordiimonadaceae bacterium]